MENPFVSAKLVIFDIDRTLYNYDPYAVCDFMGEWLAARMAEEQRAVYREQLAHTRRVYDPMSWVSDSALPFLRYAIIDEGYDVQWKYLREHSITDPGLKDALAGLRERGVKLFLWSNSSQEGVRDTLQWLGLDEEDFDVVAGAAFKPRSWKTTGVEMLEYFKVEAAEALSVGDGYLSDLKPALDVGIPCLYVGSEELEVELPRVADVRELVRLINESNRVPRT